MFKQLICAFLLCCCTIAAQSQKDIDSIITITGIRNTVGALAHDSMQGRATGSPQILVAAEFIARQFLAAGLQPAIDETSFLQPFSMSKGGTFTGGYNVVGSLIGNEQPDSIVIFSAHYDHLGVQPLSVSWQSDSIFNGANDNASGVAAIIELAKYYASSKENKYSLYFIAFAGEEIGLVGSKLYAASHLTMPIKTVINFDMVGRSLYPKTNRCMVVAKNPSKIISILKGSAAKKSKFFVKDQFPEESLYTRSDHYSFESVAETTFSFMCSHPRDKFYHELKDEVNTIDFDFLHLAIKNMATACSAFIK